MTLKSLRESIIRIILALAIIMLVGAAFAGEGSGGIVAAILAAALIIVASRR